MDDFWGPLIEFITYFMYFAHHIFQSSFFFLFISKDEEKLKYVLLQL